MNFHYPISECLFEIKINLVNNLQRWLLVRWRVWVCVRVWCCCASKANTFVQRIIQWISHKSHFHQCLTPMLTFFGSNHDVYVSTLQMKNHCNIHSAKNIELESPLGEIVERIWHLNAYASVMWWWCVDDDRAGSGIWISIKRTNASHSTRGDGRRVPFDVEWKWYENENKIGRSCASPHSNHKPIAWHSVDEFTPTPSSPLRWMNSTWNRVHTNTEYNEHTRTSHVRLSCRETERRRSSWQMGTCFTRLCRFVHAKKSHPHRMVCLPLSTLNLPFWLLSETLTVKMHKITFWLWLPAFIPLYVDVCVWCVFSLCERAQSPQFLRQRREWLMSYVVVARRALDKKAGNEGTAARKYRFVYLLRAFAFGVQQKSIVQIFG